MPGSKLEPKKIKTIHSNIGHMLKCDGNLYLFKLELLRHCSLQKNNVHLLGDTPFIIS